MEADETAVPCRAWLAGAHLLIETSLPAELTSAVSSADVGGSWVSVFGSNVAPDRPSPASAVEAFDPADKSSGDHKLVGLHHICFYRIQTGTILIHHDEEVRLTITITQTSSEC